ncbi:DUF309 domain-containing protein [Thermolongibacillus altinsuensis]
MYPQAYIDYLVYFHGDRDYFECHEILEEHWKKSGERVWIGLIQLAVAFYHERRGNRNGAKRLLEKAILLLTAEKEAIRSLGLDEEKLLALLVTRQKDIEANVPYKDVELPFRDQHLKKRCELACSGRFGQPSDMTNAFLIHKHMLRDRSDVIAERERQKQKKQQGR